MSSVLKKKFRGLVIHNFKMVEIWVHVIFGDHSIELWLLLMRLWYRIKENQTLSWICGILYIFLGSIIFFF